METLALFVYQETDVYICPTLNDLLFSRLFRFALKLLT